MAEVHLMPNVSAERAAEIFEAFDPLQKKKKKDLRRVARRLAIIVAVVGI